jgi:N-acetylglucosaminyl-diphospho-decaprenol L-rhamnosyltransferase
VAITEHPLSIVIVTYNSARQIVDCLKMFADRGPDIRVRIRDNGSTDSTPEVLKELAADGYIDDLILAPDDPGFAIAANDVIRNSANDDILFIDPDARMSLEAIQLLRDAIDRDPTLGAVSPVVRGGEEISVMSAGRQPRLWPMFTHYSGLSRAFPKSKTFRGRHLFLTHHSHEDQLVEWTSGCCLLVPRTTIDRVGVLTERWFLYLEDTEYCKRVLDAGLKIKVLSKAQAFHEVGASAEVAEDVDTGDSPDLSIAEANSLATPPIDVSSMWGRNLYDYYAHEFHPTAAARLAWKMTFTAGNGVRALARQVRNPKDDKAEHLMKNALAVWK